jgi:pyruvate dehydrogenase E2 component (dihydrolipoamide acetyltransferase)
MSSYQVVPLSGLQRLNADHLQRAQQEAAYATLHAQTEVGALEGMRARAAHDAGCPACPFVMRAVALTLRDFPRLNAQFSSEGLCIYDDVSLGLMVARRDRVLVPAVQQAGQKPASALAEEAAARTRQARDGKVHRHKQRRPTFTVIDLSGYAVDSFTPILPAQSAGIVGVGRVKRRYRPGPDEEPRARVVQDISFTFDHRAADGLYAARFLSALVERLEQPETLQAEGPVPKASTAPPPT